MKHYLRKKRVFDVIFRFRNVRAIYPGVLQHMSGEYMRIRADADTQIAKIAKK